MKYSTIVRKLAYYAAWYRELPEGEREGFIGQWIRKRCDVYNGILLDIDRAVGVYHKPTGNYPG